MKGKSFSCVQLLATPWTAAYQATPSMGFSRQEYWSGVPLPSPSYLPIGRQNFYQRTRPISTKISLTNGGHSGFNLCSFLRGSGWWCSSLNVSSWDRATFLFMRFSHICVFSSSSCKIFMGTKTYLLGCLLPLPMGRLTSISSFSVLTLDSQSPSHVALGMDLQGLICSLVTHLMIGAGSH